MACQHLLASVADVRPVGLQTAQNSKDILRIDLKLGLAKLGYVGVAGGAFLWISLTSHRSAYRRRLRRHLLGVRGCTGGKRQSDRQDRYAKHDPPLRASGPPCDFRSYPTFFRCPAHIKFLPRDSRHNGEPRRRACVPRVRGDTSAAGRLAQLVERLLYTQNVGGSSPSPPTSLHKRSAAKAAAPKPILGEGRLLALATAWRASSFASAGKRRLKKYRPPPRNSAIAMTSGR